NYKKKMNLIILLFILLNNIYCIKCFCTEFYNFSLLDVLTNTTTTAKTCKNNVDKCSYITFYIPGYAIGKISGCQEDVTDIFSNVVFQRKDITNVFRNVINNTTNKVEIPLLCKYSDEISPSIIFDTLTGNSEFFFHCYEQNNLYLTPPVSFNPPTTQINPVNCSDGEKVITCNEGYCGMLEVGYILQSNLKQINELYQSCPNNLINKVYETGLIKDLAVNNNFYLYSKSACSQCILKNVTKVIKNNGITPYYLYVNCYYPENGKIPNFPPFPTLSNQPYAAGDTTTISTQSSTKENKYTPEEITTEKITTTTKIFFIFITSVNLISQVKSTCTTYKSFKLLGKVQNSNKTILPCLNNVDSCTYISLNIPGYVIGYFSGCPENADLMLESILAGRSDLLDYFMPIIDNKTRLINHNLLCERTLNGNQPYFLKTMSGIGQFYVHCYNQNELYLNQGVKFIPPLTNSTPVLCVNGEKTDICNEGYCAMAEISSINVDGKSQYSEQYQYCPNILINLLYVKSQRPNIMFNNALLSHLFDIGPICVDKSSYQVTSKNGTSSYFWYL
uniref:Uncharacterized protein n=1 Tax=Strongyloides stercoralis TaxID=6248 RepID=A0AAF5DFX9_STRER